jgi:hypothetical protein
MIILFFQRWLIHFGLGRLALGAFGATLAPYRDGLDINDRQALG